MSCFKKKLVRPKMLEPANAEPQKKTVNIGAPP